MIQRPMNFAGAWYPADRESCRREIEGFLQVPLDELGHDARLGVVPHAGWVYSGRLAARVFQHLTEEPTVDLVVILGGHLGPRDSLLAMVEGAWDTPFGPFAIHTGFAPVLEGFAKVRIEGERHRPDNSTELQLPFAKHKFPEAELLPMRVPPNETAIELGRALADYVAEQHLDAVVVASTDLTHYGPNYGFMPRGQGIEALNWVRTSNDAALIRMIERGDSAAILDYARRDHSACSIGAVVAVNEMAQRRSQRFQVLDYATSADVAGDDADNFVGYVAGIYI